MKNIPYGESNFESLIRGENYYQDKTQYLKELESVTTAIFLRPCLFGKSLFTSMLDCYYGIDQADKFDELFAGLHVYENPTELKNQYYILNFDFSGTYYMTDEIEESFNFKIFEGAQRFIKRYHLNIELPDQGSSRTVGTLLNGFRGLNLPHKIYVIIDNYDYWITSLLEREGDCLEATSNADFVCEFYEMIKRYMKYDCVERFFATGILPTELSNMFVGLNSVEDISMNPQFSSMIGFSDEEVHQIIKETTTNFNGQLFENLRYNYGGYRFSKMNDDQVLNSGLVMYYLNYYKNFDIAPEELIDININKSIMVIKNIVKLKPFKNNYKIIEELMMKNEVLGGFAPYFDLEKRWGRYDLITVLFNLGFLTIKDIGMMTKFKIPNTVMEKFYFEYLIEMLEQISEYQMDRFDIENAIRELGENGDIMPVAELVTEFLYYVADYAKGHLINTPAQNFNEETLKVLFANFLSSNNQFLVYNEYPSKSGFIDVFIQKASGSLATFEGMIELKYLSKEDGTEERIQKELADGRAQILQYLEDEQFQRDNLKKFVIVYVGSQNYYCEEIE